MNAQIPIGIAAGIAGIGAGIGITMLASAGHDREIAKATTEWEAWRGELEIEFPSLHGPDERAMRPLQSSSDEARFEEFLTKHPAPEFLYVRSDGLRQVSVEASEVQNVKTDRIGGIAGGSGIVGGLLLGATGALLLSKNGASPLGAGLNVFGAALGMVTIGGLFAWNHTGGLQERIEGEEWHAKRHFTE